MRRVVLAEGRRLRLGLPLELEVVPPCMNERRWSVVLGGATGRLVGGSIESLVLGRARMIVEVVVQSMHPAVPP